MRHVPFFCEENVWQLAHDAELRAGGGMPAERLAVFITNRDRLVPMWAQRAGDPVVWDYHVVLLVRSAHQRWLVVDVDSAVGPELPLLSWLEASFPAAGLPTARQPMFRVCSVEELDRCFSSDRSHMRDAAGRPLQPFPPWPPIRSPLGAMTLFRFLDLDDPIAGSWLDRAALVARFGPGPS